MDDLHVSRLFDYIDRNNLIQHWERNEIDGYLLMKTKHALLHTRTRTSPTQRRKHTNKIQS